MNLRPPLTALLPAFLLLFSAFPAAAAPREAITFHAEPGKLFLPVHEVAKDLGWRLAKDDQGRVMRLGKVDLKPGTLRQLTDGTELISTTQLAALGTQVAPPAEDGSIRAGGRFRYITFLPTPQRVEVNLPKQQLHAWQGQRLVLQTNISSGRNGCTPAGNFRAGPYRARMHRSSLYHNAPMPWSVQINGNVFIHGFTSVPDYPASHGCIRVPLTGRNPARFFHDWVLKGTPVIVKK